MKPDNADSEESGAQLLAALGTTTIQNRTTGTGGHTGAETMTAGAANSAWLVGKAHGFSPDPVIMQ